MILIFYELIYEAVTEKSKTKKFIDVLKAFQEKILAAQTNIINKFKRISRFVDRAAINYKDVIKVKDTKDAKRIQINLDMAQAAIHNDFDEIERKEFEKVLIYSQPTRISSIIKVLKSKEENYIVS